MPSLISDYEYDIFISYRHNDNRSGWVTEFVNALQEELAATIKEPLSIYFDKNPHDGLLETHHVDKSLEGKLKCLILIPIISQTYCDPNSFAWQQEFCVFNKLSKEDPFGRDIKLSNGNVASRILPIKIHELDSEDQTTIESEIGTALRAIDFIFKSPGVNRPLWAKDDEVKEIKHAVFYRDQVNKVANAVKEMVTALKSQALAPISATASSPEGRPANRPHRGKILLGSLAVAVFVIVYLLFPKLSEDKPDHEIGNSIAVLYFDNISSESGQEYFSDGITEEITAHLSSIKGLRVTSRTSVIQYKGKTNAINIREIAEALNVDNILEGSVRKAGNKLRITVQLINARSDDHIWTEVYDRDLTDVFKIQSDIARAIADKFKVALSPSTEERIANVPTKNIKAYDLYLQAKAIPWGMGFGADGTGYFKSINLAKQAIELDPDFAQAYIFLSKAYQGRDSAAILAKEAIIRNPKLADGYIALAETVPDDDALKWLLKAFELDSAMGLLGLAHFYSHKADFPGAMRCYGQLIKMNPNEQTPYLEKAILYASMAEEDSLLKYTELANRIAPNSAGMVLANYSARMGRMDATIKYARQYWGTDTLNYNRHVGVIYKTARDWRMMKEYYLRTNYRDMDWGLALLKTGSRDSGVLILQKALAARIQQKFRISSLDISRIQAVLRNKAQAILHLRKLIDSGWYNLVWIRKDPYWDYVREEPEFKKNCH
jgi:TolB-like protein